MVNKTRFDIMGMHITIAIVDNKATTQDIDDAFSFFEAIDHQLSTYKKDSEISRYNGKELLEKDLSADLKEVFSLADKTKKETDGYFDIQKKDGTVDPSGIVKGWAIKRAAEKLTEKGFRDFFVDAGGDVQTYGHNQKNEKWRVGIQSPLEKGKIVKKVLLSGEGIATSGSYLRGQHVYNPHQPDSELRDIVSITVIGPNVLEADRFATAAFAMQEKGIQLIQSRQGLEGYMIDANGMATMTSGFEKYL